MIRPARAILIVVSLSLWIGAALFFGAVVAQASFAVLPTRELAGALVGRVLPSIFYAGMVVAIFTFALGLRGERQAMRLAGPSVVFLACAAAQMIVAPRIASIRAEIPGAIEALDAADPRRLMFGRLHGVSVGLLGVALIAAVVTLVVATRSLEARS